MDIEVSFCKSWGKKLFANLLYLKDVVEKAMFLIVFINYSVFNLHFMKVSREIDFNFGYEKITQLVDNIRLSGFMEHK
jgi:hypothetical protein